MLPKRSILVVLGALVVLALVQNLWYWTELPVRVATHFNAQGRPNGWMSRDSAVLTMLLFQIGMPVFLVGLGAIISRVPPHMLNVPNREYWCQPERVGQVRSHSINMLGQIAALTSLLLLGVNHLTFLANIKAQPLDTRWSTILLAVFLGAICAIIARMYLHFRVPPSDA